MQVTPRPAPAAVPPVTAPLQARCDVDRRREFPEWDEWARTTIEGEEPDDRGYFGHHNFLAVRNLSDQERPAVERLLRMGLAACDPNAATAVGVALATSLLPDLRDLLVDANVDANPSSSNAPLFRIMVIHAVMKLEPASDLAALMVPLLRHPNAAVRRVSAYYARDHRLTVMEGPLLAVVRDDISVPVREQAAETLLYLAGVAPASVFKHPTLRAAIYADDEQSRARTVDLIKRVIGERDAAPLR
jgi:hypothetical protein